MGDGAEHTLAQGHLDVDHLCAGGLQHNRRPVESSDGSPLQPLQQLGGTGDHEIDERWRRVERLLFGKGAAVVHRLLREVDQWNLASKKGYELSFSWALAPYITGSDAEDVLRAVDRKMYSKKHKLTPVF